MLGSHADNKWLFVTTSVQLETVTPAEYRVFRRLSYRAILTPSIFSARQEEEAVTRKVPAVLRKLLMLQTFGQENHTCSRSGRSVIIPPYVNVNWVKSVPGLPEDPGQPPRDKFAYFRGLVHDFGNDPWGNKYSK